MKYRVSFFSFFFLSFLNERENILIGNKVKQVTDDKSGRKDNVSVVLVPGISAFVSISLGNRYLVKVLLNGLFSFILF